MGKRWGYFYNLIQGINSVSPQGSVETVTVFPKVIDVENKRVKAFRGDGGDIVCEDLFGNSFAIAGVTGWEAVQISEITSYSGTAVLVLYME